MTSHEYKRIYHPKLGRFVFEHKGSGIIIDNIFKPLKSLASSAFKKVVKPMTKKALESGISHAGDKLGKKAAEKSGDFIMKKLHGSTKPSFTKAMKTTKLKPEEEDYNTILNRLISGDGFKKVNFM